jgi:hypothetical protein
MSSSKEKAIELVNRVSECGEDNEMYIETAKKCALIAVDEIILNCYEDMEEYWQEVKSEIEKL